MKAIAGPAKDYLLVAIVCVVLGSLTNGDANSATGLGANSLPETWVVVLGLIVFIQFDIHWTQGIRTKAQCFSERPAPKLEDPVVFPAPRGSAISSAFALGHSVAT
jgi:hypothetical protein